MADQPANKVKLWAYPFQLIGNKEIEDPQVLLHALSMAEDGTYPIGANGLWHGGVHFDRHTGAVLAQEAGVRCIADGEVVAYRIDRTYPEITYPDGKRALYSTGFVLVRHRLELPPKPGAAVPRAPVIEQPPEPALTFFSLYMHLRDWTRYEADPATPRPAFWKGPATGYRVAANASDEEPVLSPGDKGLRVRDGKGAPIGLLPRGCRVTLSPENPAKPGFFVLASITDGNSVPAGLQDPYVHKASLDPLREPDASAMDAVLVLATPQRIAAGALVGHLGEYGRYVDATPLPPTPGRPLLHLEVFTADNIEAFIATSRARAAELEPRQKSILVIESGAKLCQPAVADMMVPAGSILWRFSAKEAGGGPWLRVRKTTPTIVPVDELKEPQGSGSSGSFLYRGQRVQFTGNYVNSKGEQTTDRSKRALFTRRELLIPSGPPFWIESSKIGSSNAIPAWSAFPLRTSALSTPRLMQRRVINRRQLEKSAAETRAKDDQGVSWWKVSVGADGNRATEGWVCEKNHPQTAWKSPWDWPGFEVISESAPPLEMFSRELHRVGAASGSDEAKNLKVRADGVDGGSLLTAMREAIDAQGDRNGEISSEELKQALRQPWLADHITKLIVKYESEWGGDMSKWDALDLSMVNNLSHWESEKELISKLQWLKFIENRLDIPIGGVNSHIHTIGLIRNFQIQDCNCASGIAVEQLKRIAPIATASNIEKYLESLNLTFTRFKMEKCLTRSYFVAQILHESGAFQFTKESGRELTYDPWRGRGLIQITFKSNYEAYGKYIDEDVTSNASAYEKLEKVPHSVLSAGWFWTEFKKLDSAAEDDDFLWCTAVINGAFNGFEDRLSYLNRAIREFDAFGCAKKNKNGRYNFEESRIFSSRKLSFAWGLWSDPLSNKTGVKKDINEARKGYARYIELHANAGKPDEPDKMYGIGKDQHARAHAELRVHSIQMGGDYEDSM